MGNHVQAQKEQLLAALANDDQHLRSVNFATDPAAYEEYENFSAIKIMHLGHLATVVEQYEPAFGYPTAA